MRRRESDDAVVPDPRPYQPASPAPSKRCRRVRRKPGRSRRVDGVRPKIICVSVVFSENTTDTDYRHYGLVSGTTTSGTARICSPMKNQLTPISTSPAPKPSIQPGFCAGSPWLILGNCVEKMIALCRVPDAARGENSHTDREDIPFLNRHPHFASFAPQILRGDISVRADSVRSANSLAGVKSGPRAPRRKSFS